MSPDDAHAGLAGSSPSDDRFERVSRNPLTLLLAGFLLTGLIGPCMAADYQRRADENKREAERREIRRSAAMLVADSVSALLNRGYYLYGRYYDAIHDPALRDSLPVWRTAFDAFNQEFESREIVDAGKVCTYFGAEVQQQFLVVSDTVHWSNWKLRQYEYVRREPSEASNSLANLKKLVYDFSMKMVDGLSDEQPLQSQRCRGRAPKVR